MNEHTYQFERRDDKTWMVYKVNIYTNKTEVGYQVELDSHAPGAHQCSCPFGVTKPNGQTTILCKHVKDVLKEKEKAK